MKQPFLVKTLRLLLLVLAVSFASTSFALFVPGKDKTIRVRPNTNAGNLLVDVQPIKKSFWVNEPIRLRSKGNKPYYLYLFNVDPQTGKSIMIVPNRLQPNNYYGQQRYIVPNRDIEFFSDRPGQEKMIMVASTKALKVDFDRYQPLGHFVAGKSAAFEKSLGVRFTDPYGQKDSANLVVKTFDIFIAGERHPIEQPIVSNTIPTEDPSFFSQLFSASRPPGVSNSGDPVAFISSANNEYIEGEQFKIIFGANQKGYVHLYTIDPDGAYDFLKIVPVDGKGIQSLIIQAAPPYGRHTLVALYDQNDVINHQGIGEISLNLDKSMFVVNQSKRAIAIHPIMIKPYTAND